MSYPKIKEVTTRLWGKQDLHFTVNEDVNIIVGDGWGDKIIYMEDVTTPVK